MMGLDRRGTDAQSLLVAARRRKDNRTDAVVEQQTQQFAALDILVANRKEEAVAERFVQIVVVHDVEAVAPEDRGGDGMTIVVLR